MEVTSTARRPLRAGVEPSCGSVGIESVERPSDDAHSRYAPRLPRDRRADRRGRDGRGLPGEGFEARPRRGPQGAAGRDGVEPRTAREVPARGPRRGRAESPPHRDDPSVGGVGRGALPDHGARRRGRSSRRRGDRPSRGSSRCHRARRRARGGAREGDHPPGPEARQRHGGPRRAGQGARLRSRQVVVEAAASGRQATTGSGRPSRGRSWGPCRTCRPSRSRARPLDRALDIFSLGIILYEMRPGSGRSSESSAELAMARSCATHRDPSVVELRADLPSELGRVIGRCLEKGRGAIPVGAELRYGLRGVPTAHPRDDSPRGSGSRERAGKAWVVVLPFKHVGDDADLAALRGRSGGDRDRPFAVSVSVGRFERFGGSREGRGRRRARPRRQARRALRLEGSLREGGSAIRVSAQLVDTETGARLWAETYNRDLGTSSTFEVQDDVAARIVATSPTASGCSCMR